LSWRLLSALINEKGRNSGALFSTCSVLLSALYTNNSDFLPLLWESSPFLFPSNVIIYKLFGPVSRRLPRDRAEPLWTCNKTRFLLACCCSPHVRLTMIWVSCIETPNSFSPARKQVFRCIPLNLADFWVPVTAVVPPVDWSHSRHHSCCVW
jgi:hypothetical protein